MKRRKHTYIFHDPLGRTDYFSILQLMLSKVYIGYNQIASIVNSGNGIGGM